MPVQLRSLNDLNADDVVQNLAEVVARVQEDNPTLDLRQGVFFSLLGYYHAVLAAQRQHNIRDYLNARSLLVMEANPELADTDLVDDVLSNFRVTRKPGEKSRGDVTIVMSTDNPVVIGVGTVFEANGKRFVTEQTFSAGTEDELLGAPGELPLTPTADGNWAFTVQVVAEQDGSDHDVRKDSLVVPLTLPSGYVTSYAASDFTGGRSAETNSDLLGRLQMGVAAKAMSNRVNMAAMLREIEEFSRVVGMSIVGYGDAEMLRDQHTIWPMSLGGRCDWYVRSQEQVLRKLLVKEAVLVEKTDDLKGIWQFSIGRDEAPGFYELGKVRLPQAENVEGGFEILSETRALDLTGGGFLPDVATLEEGVYSRFQTAVAKFKDTVTRTDELGLGSRQTYHVEAVCLPLIAEIQDRVSSRDIRSYGADCLVKAPIPCFVKLHFAIHKQASAADPDVEAIKGALCTEINRVGFVGRLYASQLHDVIHGYLRDAMHVSAIDMHGRIRYPGGSVIYLRSAEVLVVPDDAPNMVSPRTVQFFAAPEDVSVVIKTVVPSDT